MYCPKCGLLINGRVSMCPRCLFKIPEDMQNMADASGNGNRSNNNQDFSQSAYSQQGQQQNYNNPQQEPGQADGYGQRNYFDSRQANADEDSFFYWISQVFKKYAVFSGRARRKEYWFFFLFNLIVSLPLTLISNFSSGFGEFAYILNILFSLGILIPSLAVAIRRLHDTGRSGFYILFPLIPIVGFIIYIKYLAEDSFPGPNQYGPNPKMSSTWPNP